jgi:hypothetical protein
VLEPPDPIVDTGLLATIFGSSVATTFGPSVAPGAFSLSACATLGPLSLEPFDPIIISFSVAAFGSGGGAMTFLVSA